MTAIAVSRSMLEREKEATMATVLKRTNSSRKVEDSSLSRALDFNQRFKNQSTPL
ncbi:hypothetical protein ABVT39_026450 [Epinephelus coioides]